MTDARWAEIDDDLDAACRHFASAAALFDAGGFEDDGLPGYRNRMALMHAMQAAHTSLEGALKRVLDLLGEEAPRGEFSHADLIRRVSRGLDLPGRVRPAILTPEVAADVDESRRFRHRAAHDYDNFEPHRAAPSVEAAQRLERSSPKWTPVRRKRARQDKELGAGPIATRSGTAPVGSLRPCLAAFRDRIDPPEVGKDPGSIPQ